MASTFTRSRSSGTSVGRAGPALNSENLKKTCFGRKWGLHNSWQVFVMLWLIGVKIAAKVARKICDLDDFWSRWQLRIWRKITHRALRSKKNIFPLIISQLLFCFQLFKGKTDFNFGCLIPFAVCFGLHVETSEPPPWFPEGAPRFAVSPSGACFYTH